MILQLLLIPAVLIIVLITHFKLKNNIAKWQKGIHINHPSEWCLMALPSIASIIVFRFNLSLQPLYAWPLACAMPAFFIWFWFNGLYNKKRKYDWWFTGDKSKRGSYTDKFLKWIGKPGQIILEIGLMIGSIVLFIIYKK